MLKVSFQWKNSDKICLCSHWAAGEILPPFLHDFYTIATISTSTKVPLGKADTATQLRAGLPVKYFA